MAVVGAAMALAGVAPTAASGPGAADGDRRRQLVAQGRHYLRKDLPEAALRFLQDALAMPGADDDADLILTATKVYRRLDRLGDAMDLLRRGGDLPRIRRVRDELERNFGRVRLSAPTRAEARTTIVLDAAALIGVAKKRVYEGVRKRLAGGVELPADVVLPYGSYVANGRSFVHGPDASGEVQVRMPRILLLLERPPQSREGFVSGVTGGFGGEYLVRSVEDLQAPAVATQLAAWRPELCVAIGPSAAQTCRGGWPGTPLVFARVPGELVRRMLRRKGPVTGVADEPPWAAVAAVFRELVPGATRIGVVLHPGRSGEAFASAAEAMRQVGLEPVAIHVQGARQVRSALARAAAKSDAFWLLPDPGIWTRENRRRWVDVALQRRLPTVAESEALVERGALLAVRATDEAVATRIVALARAIVLQGRAAGSVPVQPAERFSYVLNVDVAARLGVAISAAARSKAVRVVEAAGRPAP